MKGFSKLARVRLRRLFKKQTDERFRSQNYGQELIVNSDFDKIQII